MIKNFKIENIKFQWFINLLVDKLKIEKNDLKMNNFWIARNWKSDKNWSKG